MLTVGVDLAKEATTTVVCAVRWERGGAFVEAPVLRAENENVLTAAMRRGCAAIALDAPFGWPSPMVAAVTAWRPGGPWSRPDAEAFRLRRTDIVTRDWTHKVVDRRRGNGETGVQHAVPLSVSADKIAMAAWRCCRLLVELVERDVRVVTTELGTPFADDGVHHVVEAYPAAALAMWGVPRDGYKKPDGHRTRERMLSVIEGPETPSWIQWEPGARDRCVATDHALDAFVCALVARAAALGLVESVPPEHASAAAAEGWIALPRSDALHQRFVGGSPHEGRG